MTANDPPEASSRASIGGLSVREVQDFTRQLSVLAVTSAPLPAGFQALAEELPSGRLRRTFGAIGRQLDAGESLNAALAAHAASFPSHLRALIIAGLRSNALPEVLDQYLDHCQRATDLRRELWLSVAYPLLLLGAIVGLIAFLFGTVVPQFETIFRDWGLRLPMLTLALLAASRFLSQHTDVVAAVLVAIAALPIVLHHLTRTSSGDAGPPYFFGMLRWSAQARLARLLGMLVHRQVPLPDALDLTADAMPRRSQAREVRRVAAAAAQGHSLSDALASSSLLSPGMNALLAWGERSGVLGDTLIAVAELLEERLRSRAALLRSVLPAGLFGLVVLLVGTVAIGLVYPIFQLLGQLGNMF